jgi:hypothetical protein
MLGVTGFGLIFTPAFYTLMQRIGASRSRTPSEPRYRASELTIHEVAAARRRP